MQGPDLYDATAATLKRHLGEVPPGPCQFNIAHKARSQLVAHVALAGDVVTKPAASIGSFVFGEGRQSAVGWLVTTGEPVIERRPFAEEIIWNACAVEDRAARLAPLLPFTPAELVVSVTKKLHHMLMPPPVGRHWALTRFALVRPFQNEDAASIAVEFETSIGVVLTRCSIRVDKFPLGHVFFSLTQP